MSLFSLTPSPTVPIPYAVEMLLQVLNSISRLLSLLRPERTGEVTTTLRTEAFQDIR